MNQTIVTFSYNCAVPNLVTMENSDDEDGVRETKRRRCIFFFGEIINNDSY